MKKETLTVETNDLGTVIYRNASGDFHNPHAPAVVGADGQTEHWIHGQRHNPHGPAVVEADVRKEHYIYGKYLTKAEFKIWQAQQTK